MLYGDCQQSPVAQQCRLNPVCCITCGATVLLSHKGEYRFGKLKPSRQQGLCNTLYIVNLLLNDGMPKKGGRTDTIDCASFVYQPGGDFLSSQVGFLHLGVGSQLFARPL